MEYLPNDPNDSEAKNQEKSDKKLKEFREYIVDKGIVLAFVKVLLSLKYSENKPKNPIKAIREFFGKYHDPQWDELEALKEEIIILNQDNARLLEKTLFLEEELEIAKLSQRVKNLYKSYEMDKNVNS
jgi:hypothetical protein